MKGKNMKDKKLSTKIVAGVIAGLMILSALTSAIMIIVEFVAHNH